MRSVSSQVAGAATNSPAYDRGYRAGYAAGLAEAPPRTRMLSDFSDADLEREYRARGLGPAPRAKLPEREPPRVGPEAAVNWPGKSPTDASGGA